MSVPLLCATLAAIAGALLGREFGLVGSAAVFTAATIVTAVVGAPGPWLLAMPAALATVSLSPDLPPPTWPRAGPVHLDGTVDADIRTDWARRQRTFVLERDGHRCLCLVQGLIDVLPGDRVVGTARFRARPPIAGALLMPTADAAADALRVSDGPLSFGRLSYACRLALERSLRASITGEPGDLLCRLVLGRGPPLSERVTASHRAVGVTHLLAVSGAHASMLAAMLALAFAQCTGQAPLTSRSYRRVCAAILLLYGGVTGMEPPVFRAVVAFLLLLISQACRRRLHLSTALAVPALLTAVLAPDDLLSISFCLSYAAVIGLGLSGAMRSETWQARLLRTPLSASFWATLTTMPLTLHFFGQVAPWTIVATPLLAPAVAVMLAGGLLVGVTGLASPAVAGALAAPLQALAALYTGAVDLLARLPWAPIMVDRQPALLLLLGAGLLGVAVWVRWRDRRGFAAVCVALSLPHFLPAPPAPAGLRLLAVGHGQACLFGASDGTAVLIDCGTQGEPRRAALAVTSALLPRRRLDLLIVTHADHDHAGGIPALLQRVRVDRAVLPAEMLHGPTATLLLAQGAAVLGVDDGERLDLGVNVSVFRPSLRAASSNDRSLWVRLDCGTFTTLLPGDALEPAVHAWIATDGRSADVLLLPHHGRPHAALRALLQSVRPRLALVSNAATDTPCAQAIVTAQFGIPTLETGDRGDIGIDADGTIAADRPERLP